jgi:hypothetical protein
VLHTGIEKEPPRNKSMKQEMDFFPPYPGWHGISQQAERASNRH